MKGSTGSNTREKSYQKPPAGHRHDGGLDEETTNNRNGRWHHLQPRERGGMLSRKKIEQKTTYKKNKKMTHTVPHITLYHVMREQGTLVAPRLWADKGAIRANLNKIPKGGSPAPQI